jgi:hypothetical protein
MANDSTVTIKWQELIEKEDEDNDNSLVISDSESCEPRPKHLTASSSSVRGSTKIKSDFTLYEDLLLEEHVLRLIGKETPLEVGLQMLKTERKIDWN